MELFGLASVLVLTFVLATSILLRPVLAADTVLSVVVEANAEAGVGPLGLADTGVGATGAAVAGVTEVVAPEFPGVVGDGNAGTDSAEIARTGAFAGSAAGFVAVGAWVWGCA